MEQTSLRGSAPANRHRAAAGATWVLRVLLGGAFIFFSFMKLSSQPHMVAEFETVGLGTWFRYFTGALELVGGAALLFPRSSILGAMILLAVDVGAFVAQLTILHMGWLHCVVIGGLLLALIYLQRPTSSHHA